MGQIQTLEDILNFIGRRKWLILVVAVLGILGAAYYAKTRPDTFQASAAIQVQGAQVGIDGMSGGGAAQVLQTIEQSLTTRDALLAVIDRHGLYADLPALSLEDKATLLRNSVSFEGIATAGNQTYGQPAQISAIIISARDGSAENAARIANDFAQGVLDLAAAGQMDRAQDTLSFYGEERTRLSGEVDDLDDQIAAFKIANASSLPDEAEARRDEISGVADDLRALNQNLVALVEEQRQLAARTDLRGTDQRRLQELDGQIAVTRQQVAQLTDRRDALQAAIDRLPEVERGLAALERQLRQAQAALDTSLERIAEAETALRLAERQQGERLALLDRAITPTHPTGSGGTKLFMAGAIASVMGALALALMLELMNPVVRTSAQLERQMGLRPVMALPDLNLPRRKGPKLLARPQVAASFGVAAALAVGLAALLGLRSS